MTILVGNHPLRPVPCTLRPQVTPLRPAPRTPRPRRSPLPSSLFPLPLLLVFLAGCAGSSRPPETRVGPSGIARDSAGEPVAMAGAAGGPAAADTAAATAIKPGRFDTGKMWTFENAPLEYFQEEYSFRPSPEWLTKLRMAALRLPNCSASFVSASGLIASNHHCARDGATAVSRSGEDLLTNGFYAERQEDERQVKDLYVDQLVEIRDVTAEINAASDAVKSDSAKVAARDEKIEEIQKRVSAETRLKCEVTSLYHGGIYSLYCYRRYDDVRLVFVPEAQMGYFGGDPDNFTYPRYDLDVSFFRAYDEHGVPVKPAAHLAWSAQGAKAGDPVFVVGNPGSTSRLHTMAQLFYKRDRQNPFTLRLLRSRAEILDRYIKRHPDKRASLINDYFSISNSLKAIDGEQKGLKDPELMARKTAFERAFKRAVQDSAPLAKQYGAVWDSIARIRRAIVPAARRINAVNQGGLLRSRTLGTAATMLQFAGAYASGSQPDSALRAMRMQIDSVHIDRELDSLMLSAQIEDAIFVAGREDPFATQALGGRLLPEAVSHLLSSAVADSARRSDLLDDPRGLFTSQDPVMFLVRDALTQLGAASRRYQELLGAEEIQTGKLARALFEVYGTKVAPDATFTLRLADGVVKGYEYNGTEAPAFTTFYGMYDRHFSNPGKEPWSLPERWRVPPAGLDLSTPLNLVTTADITGGNSGSPLVNRNGEVVGLVFDGNIESLPGEFIYTTEASRSVAVHSAAILQALRTVYRARRLAEELAPEGSM